MTERFSAHIGKPYDEIEDEIKSENPGMKVHFLPEFSIVTMDYNTKRMRVWYNKDTKKVSRITIG
jgi:hypothetical protein